MPFRTIATRLWGDFSPKRFAQDRQGGVLTIFVLTIPVLAMSATFAVEYVGLSAKRDRMQVALDAATLAATKALWDEEDIAEADLKRVAANFFRANLNDFDATELDCSEIDIQIDREEIAAVSSVRCAAPTAFGKLFAAEGYNLGVSSSNNFDFGSADIAFMLDTTGSMGSGGRMATLKDAMESAIDKLTAISRNGSIRLALAPYAAAVNAGKFADDATAFFNDDGDSCVTERSGDEAFTDAPPKTSPFRDDNNFKGSSKAYACPEQTVMPLTDDAEALKAHVRSLDPNGFTAGHLGIGWSWYLISPEWRGFWPTQSQPLADDGAPVNRSVVLMTDGEFNTAWLGSTLGDSFAQARGICDEMRASGITVFSVVFRTKSAKAEDVMRYCATDPSMFFQADDNDELLAAYDTIVNSFRRLLLTDVGAVEK